MMAPESPGGQLLGRLNALSDASRLRMLALLAQVELGVSELAASMQMPQSSASRHLRRLLEAGWVTRRSEGVQALYSLAADDLNDDSKAIWSAAAATLAQDSLTEEDRRRADAVIAQRQVDSSAFFGAVGGAWSELRENLFGTDAASDALLSLCAPDMHVVDLGCGTGYVASVLAPWVGHIDAVDREAAMLDASRKRLAGFDNITFHHADVMHPPLLAGCCDVALMTLLLHHIEHPAQAVTAAAALLKPGGRLLIVDMVKHDRRDYRNTMGHVHLGFDEADVDAWATAAGLQRSKMRRLRTNTDAKGPALFAAVLHKTT